MMRGQDRREAVVLTTEPRPETMSVAIPDEGQPIDLEELTYELLQRAAAEHAGRAARTLPHPVDGLRQTVIALTAGTELSEHESPGAASLLVLRGRARLVAGEKSVELRTQQIAPIPDRRHSLHAEEDTVVLLTVVAAHRDR
jgi:quercetin dioxygenase-like cupin family protein